MMRERAAQYLRTLADCGSISEAAARLYITPSALSKYISTLERETGNALFSRLGNRFVLTQAGERALTWLTRLESLSEQMDQDMRDLAHLRSGKIRFGVQTTLSDFMLREILPAFSEQYPGIDLSMTEEASLSILQRLRRYELDFAISTHAPSREQYHVEPLIELEQVLIVPRGHRLAEIAVRKPGYRHPWVDIGACEGECFILMHSGQSPQRDMQRILSPIAGRYRTALEVRTMRSMMEAVEQGMGIMLSADGIERMYSNAWRNLVKLSYGEGMPPRVFYLYYDRELHRSLATNALLDLIRERFKRLKEEIESGEA